MKVKLDVVLYRDKINLLEQAQLHALEKTAEAILSDAKTSATIPKETGMLEDSGFVDVKNAVASIIFDTPYARRLYWNPDYNFRTDKNPNAGGMWLEPYISGTKKQWVINTYKTFLKELAGGLIT